MLPCRVVEKARLLPLMILRRVDPATRGQATVALPALRGRRNSFTTDSGAVA